MCIRDRVSTQSTGEDLRGRLRSSFHQDQKPSASTVTVLRHALKHAMTLSRRGVGRTELGRRRRVHLAAGCSSLDWMRLTQDKGRELAGIGAAPLQVYTEEELALHNTDEDAWTAINGKVYNMTPYMDFHPGGVHELMRGAGIDSTHLFDEFHAWVTADAFLEKCHVGFLAKGVPRDPQECAVMSPTEFRSFELLESTNLTHNSKLLRFKLEDGASLPQWHLCQHVRVRAIDNKAHRDYTVYSPPDAAGHFELIVKRYEGGPVSDKVMHGIEPGDEIEVKGPLMSNFRDLAPHTTCLLMLAAGTGVCLLYTSPSPRDRTRSRMPSSA
eukprot:TRINITY_DN50921_c0_g1_i2.p1 TRINITY_DN50921_c0_g1~~TRINITY_DN50921_c0_g1_i2.p1  ORF type:complete len:327 (-),score=65.87 TRINITY_DN50921_c0_g1_i2:46-1026(-)